MKTFKVDLTIKSSGEISVDNLKNEILSRLDDFSIYNDEGEEVEITLPNFWENIDVYEI